MVKVRGNGGGESHLCHFFSYLCHCIITGIQTLKSYLRCKQFMSQCTANTKQANITDYIYNWS